MWTSVLVRKATASGQERSVGGRLVPPRVRGPYKAQSGVGARGRGPGGGGRGPRATQWTLTSATLRTRESRSGPCLYCEHALTSDGKTFLFFYLPRRSGSRVHAGLGALRSDTPLVLALFYDAEPKRSPGPDSDSPVGTPSACRGPQGAAKPPPASVPSPVDSPATTLPLRRRGGARAGAGLRALGRRRGAPPSRPFILLTGGHVGRFEDRLPIASGSVSSLHVNVVPLGNPWQTPEPPL